MRRRDLCKAGGVVAAAFTLPLHGQEPLEPAEPGAAHLDLYEVDETEDSTDTIVGRVIALTTAAGLLIVEVHLSEGWPSAWFEVIVEVNGATHEEDIGYLFTNGVGIGNTHCAAQLSDYLVGADDTEVVVRVQLYMVEEEE